jgi:hypothetical protein
MLGDQMEASAAASRQDQRFHGLSYLEGLDPSPAARSATWVPEG